MIIENLQVFYDIIDKTKPILSIDYGSKKVGVAISNPTQSIAMPIDLIIDKSLKNKLLSIEKIINKNNVCAIVLGLPINMDGTDSNQTKEVKKFASSLENITDLPIFLQDERLTSRAASNFLKNFNMNRKERDSKDDMAAASMILETVLKSISNFKN